MEIEGIITEHFMEMLWPQKKENGEVEFTTTINRVDERDPLLFKSTNNAKIIAGFRFFDVRKVVISEDPEDIIEGKSSNYSTMFYYGRRLSIEQMRKASALSRTVEQMEQEGSNEAIFCFCGCYITNPPVGSLTLEEYEQMIANNQETDKKLGLSPVEKNKPQS